MTAFIIGKDLNNKLQDYLLIVCKNLYLYFVFIKLDNLNFPYYTSSTECLMCCNIKLKVVYFQELLKRHVFSYKGRIDLDHCDIIPLPDGKGG